MITPVGAGKNLDGLPLRSLSVCARSGLTLPIGGHMSRIILGCAQPFISCAEAAWNGCHSQVEPETGNYHLLLYHVPTWKCIKKPGDLITFGDDDQRRKTLFLSSSWERSAGR